MPLPVKTANREDRLHLERAAQCLSEAKNALKTFSKTRTVKTSSHLAPATKDARRRIKKAIAATALLSELWNEPGE